MGPSACAPGGLRPGCLTGPPLPAKNRPAPYKVSAIFFPIGYGAHRCEGIWPKAKVRGRRGSRRAVGRGFPFHLLQAGTPGGRFGPRAPSGRGRKGLPVPAESGRPPSDPAANPFSGGPSWLGAGGDVPGVCGGFLVTDTLSTRGWTRPRPRGPTKARTLFSSRMRKKKIEKCSKKV